MNHAAIRVRRRVRCILDSEKVAVKMALKNEI
jgi:hypothetical protein